MEEVRKGRQTPTVSFILPYLVTKGKDAIDLYNTTSRTAQEWQELALYDILATNDDGLWTHTKIGYSVPRRNGKNEILTMRELYALENGERVMHTAHRTTTSHAAWERLIQLMNEHGWVEGKHYKTAKQFGLERIEMLEGCGIVNFRTRSSKGGLGEGYDLLIIDEAQEYTDDQESALKYVVSDSANPQTIMCGTPPTTVSAGTVFTKFRDSVLQGGKKNAAWFEWSVPKQSDCNNIELWYETNPSMGTILTERKIEDEIGEDVIDFNIQRLGLWIKYNQKSAISQNDWNKCKCEEKPTEKDLQGKLYVGIKCGKSGEYTALSVAVKKNEKIFVEAIDCRSIREGNAWIIDFIKNADVAHIAIDGANGQETLKKEMKDAKIKKTPLLPTTKEVIQSFSMFEKAIFEETLCHYDQPSLTQVVTNCEKRAIGSNGGFGYNSLSDQLEISLLDSIALAHWLCSTKKDTKIQKVNY